jgi:hypothetical protein
LFAVFRSQCEVYGEPFQAEQAVQVVQINLGLRVTGLSLL